VSATLCFLAEDESRYTSLRGGLDLGLHGIEGARRVLPTSHWQYLHWWGFVDDVAMLRERFAAKAKAEWDPDPRHIWLTGGALAPDLTTAKVLRGLGPRRAAYLGDIGRFALPCVVDVMVDALEDKQAKDLPATWLREHVGFAHARVAARASTGDVRARAALALMALP
jgi:hypothetical protein